MVVSQAGNCEKYCYFTKELYTNPPQKYLITYNIAQQKNPITLRKRKPTPKHYPNGPMNALYKQR